MVSQMDHGMSDTRVDFITLFLLVIQWPGYNPRYGTQNAIQFSIDTTRTTGRHVCKRESSGAGASIGSFRDSAGISLLLVFICMYPSAHIFSGIVTKFVQLVTICIIHCIHWILVFDGYSSYICVPQPRPNGTLSGRETLIPNSGAFCSAWIPEARIFWGVHFRKALRKVS